MEKIMHKGVDIEPMDNGYGRTVYRVGRTQFGNLDAAKREIDLASCRPKVEWHTYRGRTVTIKTWPNGRVTYHGLNTEVDSVEAFEKLVDEKYGPDIWTAQMDNIKGVEYKWTEVTGPELHVTNKQRATIEALARDILEHDGLGLKFMHEYEYKHFDIGMGHYGQVYVYTVVGRKGDEATMGAVFCRTTRNMTVGPRGGVQDITKSKNHKHRSGYQTVLIHGGRN